MRNGLKYGALLIILSFEIAMFSKDASAESQYNCKTHRFSSVDEDKDFRIKNERKEFTIYDAGETLVVKMSSPDFESTKSEYKVLFRDEFGLQAYIPSAFSFALEALNLSFLSADADGERYEATVNMLGSFYSNTWLLRCNKLE
jgi:hypothetical protein